MVLPAWCLRLLTILTGTCGLMLAVSAAGQDSDPEEAREASVVARFVTVLEKNPRRGTALDKVYGFHVERGTLDGLIKTYRGKADAGKGTDAAGAWMIVGLLEGLRGRDASAVEAFGKAEQLDSASYLASYYLGQSLVLVGQPDKAAEAFERAIQRKPAQADQLDIFQALGRVYQRALKNDKALEVWNRLEKQFPNDVRVQEQIATTLLEENDYAAALTRFENLAKTSKDMYRQSLFQMEVAEIKLRLGKPAEAIRQFESLLGQLNPDNWLFREVRRKIENVYLRTDDQAGLVAYYEEWTKKHPEDLEAISRLARLLSGLGRGPEAQQWLEKGLIVAPSNKELRNALISMLIFEKHLPEAIAQYEQLDKYEPNNPDTLRDWGRLILKDSRRDEGTRRKDAAAVWRRLTSAKPKDPLIAAQVAELFRHAEMVDEALALYRQAIELAPDAAQYKEYLGEYFHSLQRKEEALATWRQMVDGPARTAANAARLAEVLAGFGYLPEAIETNAEACKLDAKDINLQIKQADLLSQAEQHDESLQQLAIVQKLIATDEEREAWLRRELKELQTLEQLKGRIADMRQELTDSPEPKTDRDKQDLSAKWFWMARACEAERQLKDAAEAVAKAGELAPQSIPVLTASARILEAQNNLLGAVEINTRLAAIDRRFRTEYLKKVAQLEVALGRRDKALQAGRDLVAAAPGNPDLYEFFSQLCFQLGQGEEGLQALRRSVRVNPTESRGLLLLAAALSEQFRTSESIELYWRAFDIAPGLDDRLSVVQRLTELYLQTNQFDRLLERLERQRRETNQPREMTICIAQAYQSAGDDGNARQELEKLLTEDSRDSQLLQQLVKLCEQDGDLEAATRFQQQLNKVAPSKEGSMRLAQLLMKSGETEEANAIMNQIATDEKDPEQLTKSLDAMLSRGDYERARRITERLVREQPNNWEYLYRDGVALAATKPEEATERFQAILALGASDDEPSVASRNQAKRNQARSGIGVNLMQETNRFLIRSQSSVLYIRQLVGLEGDDVRLAAQQQYWVPSDFGDARMASLGWLTLFARNAQKEDEFVRHRRALMENSTDQRATIDWYYLATLRSDGKEQYEILKRLSYLPDTDRRIKAMYLTNLGRRAGSDVRRVVNPQTGAAEIQLNPLDNEELDHVVACFKELQTAGSAQALALNQFAIVTTELKRAGRAEEANRLQQEAIESASIPAQITAVLQRTSAQGDYDQVLKLLDRLAEFKPDSTPAPGVNLNVAQVLSQFMARQSQKKELADIMPLWDRYLALAVHRYDAQKAAPAASKRSAGNASAGMFTYTSVARSGGVARRVDQFDFPSPNDVYDQATLQLLRQVFGIYHEADAAPQLIARFRQQRDEDQSATRQLFWRLGLGYLYWWNDDKDEAVTELTEAAALLPGNDAMTLELAQMHEKRREPGLALELIDSLPVADQQTVQQREIAALRLSVNSGNIERARIAAERLFGLRLDPGLQIQLSQQMHQLGMHEQAEAVLARASRQAGNKTDVLMTLMQQYQSQGKGDVAVQIAYQLLRRSPGNPAQPGAVSRSTRTIRTATGTRTVTVATAGGMGGRIVRDDGARQQALQVLKLSGKLPELIKKAEEQLSRSPKSQKLLETLIEYYTADGNDSKVAELSTRYSEMRGNDPQYRYQLAIQLVRAGKHAESLEHFKAAIKQDPRLMRTGFPQIQNAFQNAGKQAELATLFEELDLTLFRPAELSNLINNLSRQEQTKDRSIALFKRAWQELPTQRQMLLTAMNGDEIWKIPDFYEYARQGIIPTEASLQQSRNQLILGRIRSYDGEGRIITFTTRFLTLAGEARRLDELAAEVQQAMETLKTWDAGEPLLAMINLRRGRVDEARATFEKLLHKSDGNQPNDFQVRWEIGQELMAHESCIDLAIQFLEASLKDSDSITGNSFNATPGKLLVKLYEKRGRKEDARRVLLQATKIKPLAATGLPQGYDAYRRLTATISVGNELRAMGYPLDAIRVYQQMLASPDDLAAAERYMGNSEQMVKQLETGLKAAIGALTPESLPELLTPSPESKEGRDAAPLDLVLIINSRDLDKTRLTSAIGKLVEDLSKSPAAINQTRNALAAVRARNPDDLSALILFAQLSIRTKDEEETSAAVNGLVELIGRVLLEAPPSKGGFSTKQREAARQQVALWLVARDCLRQESLRSRGTALAERALEASRRQTDQGYTLAILKEWGQIALDAGDRQTAEKCWSEMLDIIIPAPVDKTKQKADAKTSRVDDSRHLPVRPRQDVSTTRMLSRWEQMMAPLVMGQFGPPAAPAVPARASRRAVPTSGTKGSVVTLTQFEQATHIARLAAENGFHELSLRAMSQALHAGPPIELMQEPDISTSGFPVAPATPAGRQSPIMLKVEERVAEIEQLWRKKGMDDDAIYSLLKQTVLPEGRPLEVFLYPRPLTRNPNQTPQSVGLRLVQAAVRTGQVDNLRQAITPRLQQPLGELPARILMTQLAIATRDNAAAKEQIEALSKRLKQDSSQYSNELACHIAIPAMSLPDLPPAAVTMLERAVEHFVEHFTQNAQQAQQGRAPVQDEALRTFRFKLARFHFQNGNLAAGKKHLEDHLNSLAQVAGRGTGTQAQNRRRLELLKVGAEYAQAGLRTELLECLGQYIDIPAPQSGVRDEANRAGAMIFSRLAQLPPAEMYELLKRWTLPTTERKSVRVFAGLIPADKAPPEFDALRGTAPRGPSEPQLVSTSDLLVAAAHEQGKLDELQRELQPLADQNVENARFLLLMTQAAQGNPAKVATGMRDYLQERKSVLPNQGETQKRPQLVDAILARFVQRDPELAGIGRELGDNFIQHCFRAQDHLMLSMMRHDNSASLLGAEIATRLDQAPANPGLKHWTAASTVAARTDSVGAAPMWWLAHEGLVRHICGPDQSHLYFKYPLTGTFELTCDAWLGGWSEADHGYGGLAFVGLHLGRNTSVFPIGNPSDETQLVDAPEKVDGFNRLKLKVQPDKISYYVNDSLVHVEPVTATTSPWFFLYCERAWQSCFRNIQISGSPDIPREVQLSQAESLLGWCSTFYGEKHPSRNVATGAAVSDGAGTLGYDWWSKEGVIYGRALPVTGLSKSPVQQSRLYYDRPLLDGERLRYEFWYDAGGLGEHVHPALDRLAILLDPDGVKLHWMTDGAGQDDAYSGLVPENVLTDKSIQRGKVQLKDKAWNSVEISLQDQSVAISLNGTVVCERPLEIENSRQFGFYHDKNSTSVKVRDVVLTGNWPRQLSPQILSELTSPETVPTDAERQLVGNIIDEKFHSADVDEILLRTRKLPPAARYAALKSWVLPNADHAAFRMYGDTAPADPTPASRIVVAPVRLGPPQKAQSGSVVPQKGAQSIRQRSGGELIAPVIDLVAVAGELGKLDELSVALLGLSNSNPSYLRPCLATQALIAMARAEFKQAEKLLGDLEPLCGALDDGAPTTERWPELLAAWEAMQFPALRAASAKLFHPAIDAHNRRWRGLDWEVKVRSAGQYASALHSYGIEMPSASAATPRRQWTQVTLLRSDFRARGVIPRWVFAGDEAVHLGGYGNDLLYFQSPLRGTLALECELTTSGWRENHILYGTNWAAPRQDFAQMDLGNLSSAWDGPKIEPKLPTTSKWYAIKVQVEPGKASYFVRDHKIYEQPLPESPDPWLAIHTFGNFGGSVRGIRITGQPDIPAELDLSALDDLTGWLAEQYGDSITGSNPVWSRNGEEIVGRMQEGFAGRSKESTLQYHRPLLEDGEISYDFFYVPDQTHVHPALGRIAFLLDPKGVRIHWLTDAQFERTGLTPDNATDEPIARHGGDLPLLPNDWNKLQLSVRGDQVALMLNGKSIYERPIDAGNQRTFGLFYYAGDTDVRVKNVRYRGAWPKVLPSPNEQELGPIDAARLSFHPDELPARFSWDYKGDVRAPLRITGRPDGKDRVPVDDGIRLTRSVNVEKHEVGYEMTEVSIKGDFALTIGYRDFQSKSARTEAFWNGPRVELMLALGGRFEGPGHKHSLVFYNFQKPDKTMHFSIVDAAHPNPQWRTSETVNTESAGRMRILRRGSFVYFLFAPPGTEDWRLLDRRDVAPDDVNMVVFGIRTQSPTESVSSVLTEFSLQAKAFGYVPRLDDNQVPAKLQWKMSEERPASIQVKASDPSNKLQPVKEGIRVTRPEDPRQTAQPVGYEWHGMLRGDFEVTLGYRDFESKTDQTDHQIPRIEIHIPIGGPAYSAENTHTAVVGLRQRNDGSLLVNGGVAEHQRDGSWQWKIDEQPVDRSSGRIRLVRVGSMIYALTAPAGSDQFIPITSQRASDGDVNSIQFTIRSESKKSSARATFTEFSIRAMELDRSR